MQKPVQDGGGDLGISEQLLASPKRLIDVIRSVFLVAMEGE